MADITIFIEDEQGTRQALTVPNDMGLSLMEALKASDYPILATCGGMALCATCHIELLQGDANPPTDDELNMLDTLFNTTDQSRLSCQIKLASLEDGAVLRLMGESN